MENKYNTFILVSILFASFFGASTSRTIPVKPSRYGLKSKLHDARSDTTWQQYVRAPSSTTVYPTAILSGSTLGNVTNPNGLLPAAHGGGNGPTILNRSSGSSDIPTIVVDFGQNIVGYLSINFASASANSPGLKLAFSETTEYLTDTSDFTRSYNGDAITPGTDQIAVQSQAYTWTDVHECAFEGTKVCSDGLHGFRYVKIYLDTVAGDAPYTTASGEVWISSMSLDFTAYLGTPNTFTGWFESSDDQLNQWWYDAVYTNDMCIDTVTVNTTDPRNAASPSLIGKLVVLDGAKRDRDPYVGDLAVSGRTSYISHDISIASKDILADLADHQRDDGWIPPASINNYTLPLLDYSLYWVTCSYDLFMYTGDTDYVTKYYPALVKVLDTFFPSVTDSNGLINKNVGIAGGYGDYAFLGRTGPVTYFNMLYNLALINAASIATALGNNDDASRWISRSETVTTAVNNLNFDDSVGAFFDGLCGNEFCATHAQDGNSLSIVSGAANGPRTASILSYLASHNARPYGNSFYDNDVMSGGYGDRVYAFISYFEIQARFMANQDESALEEIRRLYGWMSTNDPEITMWEGISSGGAKYEGAYTSLAHGWSTGVAPALTNFVLGVLPTGPGFSTWTVRPHPGGLSWAQGQVPTPTGAIVVSWAANPAAGLFHLSLEAPARTSGIVSVPVANSATSVWLDGGLVWDGTASASRGAAASYMANSGVEPTGTGFISVQVSGDGSEHVVTVGTAEGE